MSTQPLHRIQMDGSIMILSWHWRQRSEEHTSELQSLTNIVCRLLLEKKKALLHNRGIDKGLMQYYALSLTRSENKKDLVLLDFPSARQVSEHVRSLSVWQYHCPTVWR